MWCAPRGAWADECTKYCAAAYFGGRTPSLISGGILEVTNTANGKMVNTSALVPALVVLQKLDVLREVVDPLHGPPVDLGGVKSPPGLRRFDVLLLPQVPVQEGRAVQELGFLEGPFHVSPILVPDLPRAPIESPTDHGLPVPADELLSLLLVDEVLDPVWLPLQRRHRRRLRPKKTACADQDPSTRQSVAKHDGLQTTF